MGRPVASFENSLTDLADLARALAHPGRLRILQILARRRDCICGDIVEQMPLSQSTVSQHLKELRRVGLIRGQISGPRTCYCLDDEVVERTRSDFADLFAGLSRKTAGPGQGDLIEL